MQLANFAFVPAHLRILLVNVVSLGWKYVVFCLHICCICTLAACTVALTSALASPRSTYLSWANGQTAPVEDKVKELIQ